MDKKMETEMRAGFGLGRASQGYVQETFLCSLASWITLVLRNMPTLGLKTEGSSGS